MTRSFVRDSEPRDELRRKHDFRLYWLAGALDRLGSQASTIAFPLMTLAVTRSPAATGLVGAIAVAGRLVAAPVAGVLADRVCRRRMMVIALLVAAASMSTVFGLVTADVLAATTGTVCLLSAVAFVEGAAQACYGAAGSSALRRVLPADDQRALSQLEARNHAAQIAGPVLGGVLYQLGRAVPFLVDALSYVAAAALVARVRTDLDAHSPGRSPFLRELRDGLDFVRLRPFLRFVTVWSAGVNLVFGALIYYAILASGQRQVAPVSTGLILAVASVGGLVGALFSPQIVKRVRPTTIIVLVSWAMVCAVALLAFARHTWNYGALFGVVFAMSPVLGVVLQSRTIALTPDRLQGRVATVLDTTGRLVQLPAPLIAGFLVAGCGPRLVAGIFAVALGLLAVYATSAGITALEGNQP